MSDALRNLDEPCSACARPVGDHTLREWSRCLGAPPEVDLPYEEIPPDAARHASDVLTERFARDSDLLIADQVVAKSLVVQGERGRSQLVLPAVLLEFTLGLPGAPPLDIAKVVFLGSEESIAAFGRLVRETAAGAVRAARR